MFRRCFFHLIAHRWLLLFPSAPVAELRLVFYHLPFAKNLGVIPANKFFTQSNVHIHFALEEILLFAVYE